MDIVLFALIVIMLAAIAYRLWKPPTQTNVLDPEIVKLGERFETTNRIWDEQVKGLREEIRNQISESRKEEAVSRENSTKNLLSQIQDFTGKFGEMKAELEDVNKGVKEVNSFQTIFKNPKLTGEWGEAALGYLLSQYFPRKDSYESQHQFPSGEKVDFALTLPNGRILPIDSKYPQDIFTQFIKAVDPEERDTLRKALVARVKKDIDDIASKYILPNENTVDFAIMYIPAESLYYEIVSKEDLNTYAWNKKVVLASPNNFILTIGIILHWFKDADIGKKTDVILKKLQRVAIDGEKLADSFRKLGSHLLNAKGAYDDSEKRLAFLVERVQDATGLIGDGDSGELLGDQKLPTVGELVETSGEKKLP